jgi:hypothetical protein
VKYGPILSHRMIDIALGKFAGMSAAVKREEAPNPVEVGLFGTATVVLAAQGFHHAVVEPRRLTKEQS